MEINGLTDVHCHLLPYVDDGAENLTEAKRLLALQVEQGVETVFLTVHLRHHMFETPQQEAEMQFAKFCRETEGEFGKLKLILGRENHCDRIYLDNLEKGILPTMGDSRYVLMEFHQHSSDDLRYFVKKTIEAGYKPIVAHMERYPAIERHPELAEELSDMGAMLQMNAEGLLGEMGGRYKKRCWKIMKTGIIDLVASDSHHIGFREPNLGDCAAVLRKKLSDSEYQRIMFDNPRRIVEDK